MAKTKIEWADRVWNPIAGCTKVSEGCRNCYAERMAKRLQAMGKPGYMDVVDDQGHWNGKVYRDYRRIIEPMTWKKPSRIFVDSMSDPFHPSVPFHFLAPLLDTMADERCSQHIFIVLTKRPERIGEFISWANEFWWNDSPWMVNRKAYGTFGPNIWGLVSVEDQKAADTRIPYLLQAPFAVRGVSCEPLIGPVNISRYLTTCEESCGPGGELIEGEDDEGEPLFTTCGMYQWCKDFGYYDTHLDWVIAGGESGPGARPMHPDWARSLRDQCQLARVPFFFKQWGEWGTNFPQGLSLEHRKMAYAYQTTFYRIGKQIAGRELDGREWTEFPEVKGR